MILSEEQLTAAHKEGMDPEFELVEQTVLQQRLPKETMSVGHEVLAILRPQLGRLGRHVSLDDHGVAPIRSLLNRRNNALSVFSVSPMS